jgi:hypothetical protein
MQLSKIGPLGVLGAALAMPAMAQTGNQGMWQGQGGGYSGYDRGMNQGMNGPGNYVGGSGPNGWRGGGYSGHDQGMNGPGNYSGGFGPNSSGGYANSPNGWRGGEYGPGGSPPQGQSSGGNYYGQGGPGNQGGFPHQHLVAREVHALRQALEQAGFRNVHVLPQSFLVRAQDQQGRRVLMIIDPHGLTEVTELNSGQGGYGGSTMQGGSGSGSMQHPGEMSSNGWSSGVTNPEFGRSRGSEMAR